MTNRQKVIFYSILAVVFAASSAISAANESASHAIIVLPLVVMGIFLFFAGYYSGQIKK